jgi:iron(III) transport system substrate-binding protein
MASDRPSWAAPLILLFCAALLLAVWTVLQTPNASRADRLVVYCAHDAVFAEEILRQFERQTGIRVDVRYDTEATKSLGLVQQIIQEAPRPRCDVFWNNELLGTKELQDRGLLQPYQGAAWQRLPEQYKDPDGHWVGFGARLRVYIVNADKMPATEQAVADALKGDLSQAAIARPMFGTTLTQYSLMWERQGADSLKAWHADLRRRGIKEVAGNAMVKNLVAAGTCAFGFTDTDDVFVARDDGFRVAMLPIRVDGNTICIPNTAAVIRGTKRHAAAEKLVDYLASTETELALARSKSRQVPLGPVNIDDLPADVRPLYEWAKDGADLSHLLPARRECLKWLRGEPNANDE